MTVTDRPLRRFFWRVADQLDYLVTLARLRIPGRAGRPSPGERRPIGCGSESGRERIGRIIEVSPTTAPRCVGGKRQFVLYHRPLRNAVTRMTLLLQRQAVALGTGRIADHFSVCLPVWVIIHYG
jgi:hypothetical protein